MKLAFVSLVQIVVLGAFLTKSLVSFWGFLYRFALWKMASSFSTIGCSTWGRGYKFIFIL